MAEAQAQQKPEKEERIDLKVGVPVSVGTGLAARIFGMDAEEAIPSPDFSPQGQGGAPPGQGENLQFNKGGGQGDPEEEEMMASMMEVMGEIPQGVKPEEVQAMVAQGAGQMKQMRAEREASQPQARSAPAGQPGGATPTSASGGIPTSEEALVQAREAPTEVTSKKDFRAEAGKSPEWWKKLMHTFSGGIVGETEQGFERKLDRAYAEHIAPQLEARAEQERQRNVTERFVPEPGEELVTWKFGDREIEIARKDTAAVMGMVEKEYDAAKEKDNSVSLRTLMPDDPNAPDWSMPRDKALEYAEFFIDQRNAGLGTGRDLLKVKRPKLWAFFEKHEQDQALALIDARENASDKIKQITPSQAQMEDEINAMYRVDDYGTTLSPEFEVYLKAITGGEFEGTEIEHQAKVGYARNLLAMRHEKLGKASPWSEDRAKSLKENGLYFMGEFVPYDKVKARAHLTKMKEAGTINRFQARAFLETHFNKEGAFLKDFLPKPPAPGFFDPEAQGVERIEPSRSRLIPSTKKAEQEAAKKKERERPNTEMEAYPADVAKLAAQYGWEGMEGYDRAAKEYEKQGYTIRQPKLP